MKEDSWLGKPLLRRNPNVAAVALANKNARVVWALLAKDRTYRRDPTTMAAGV
jgi:poly-gamma-glutamate capsule biosynthesis protein CapA/YwtB (metallophosphatase superfamily)